MASTEYIYANLTSREVTSSTGTNLAFNWVAGQDVSYAIRFLERSPSGTLDETTLELINFRAAIGKNEPPTSGTYRIKIGRGISSSLNTTREIDWNAGPHEVEEALNSLASKPCEFQCDQGDKVIIVRGTNGEAVHIEIYPEGLLPASYGKVLDAGKFKEIKSKLTLSGLTYTGKLVGELGNLISVEYLGSGPLSSPLSVSVVGTKITVFLEKNNVGNIIKPTGLQIKAVIDASPAASALVSTYVNPVLQTADLQGEAFLAGGQNGSGNEYALELVQAPVAFTNWLNLKLPPIPTVKVIQTGGVDGGGFMKWPTVMALYVPPDFRGSYQFQRTQKTKRSTLCSKEDGADTLRSILQEMMQDEGARMKVTNPNTNIAHLEFGGDLNGIDIPVLDISVYSAPPADYAFSIDLGSAALDELLHASSSVSLSFEAEGTVWIDPADPAQGTKTIKLWQTTAAIRRPLLWDELSVKPPIDWQRKISPVDYVPFSPSQVYSGQSGAYRVVIGDAVSKEFDVIHNLGASGGIIAVAVREAGAGGRMLRDSAYELFFESNDKLKIVFPTGPGVNEYEVIVVGYGSPSVFQPHTHTIDQVRTVANGTLIENLRDILEDIVKRVARLESLIPKGAIAAPSGLGKREAVIPPVGEILPDIAMEGDDVESGSQTVASQVIYDPNKGIENQKAAAIPGTDLEQKQKENEAEVLKSKATGEAATVAARDAAKKAADEVLMKAKRGASQAGTDFISKVLIDQFGTWVETTTNVTETVTSASGTTTTIRPVAEKTSGPSLYPAKRNGKYAWLLPAIHSSAVTATTSVPDIALAKGVVYRNNGSSSLVLPGGGGRKGQTVLAGEYFGGDGRCLYALRSAGSSTSYYPVEMERNLMRVMVWPSQFPANSELLLSWQLELSCATDTLVAGAEYVMRVELTPVPDASTPVVTAENVGNLGAIVPVMASRIVFSRSVSEVRWFSIKLKRSAAGGTSEYVDYGVKSLGPIVPQGPFLLTVRLVQWDVDDGTSAPTGQVGVFMPETQMTVEAMA
jgi:hypothetical protein